MKRLLWILLPLVMMTACIETTPEDLNGSDNGSDSNEWPFEDDEDKEDDDDEQEDVMPYIYGMKFIDGDGYVFYWEFDYDEEGHLIYYSGCDEFIINFSWKDDNTIEASGEESLEGVYQCDDSGRPIRFIESSGYSMDFRYGRNGYISEVEHGGDIEDTGKVDTFATRSGNYVKIPTDHGDATCEYSSHLNNYALDINNVIMSVSETPMLYFWGMKLPGAYSRNLLSGYAYDGEYGSCSYEFEYFFDETGNIDKVDVVVLDDDFNTSCTFYFDYGQGYSDGSSAEEEKENTSVTEALELADETYAEMTGTVVATTGRGVVIADDADGILYVYNGADWDCPVEVGDLVEVGGTMQTYWDNRELLLDYLTYIGSGSYDDGEPYALTENNLYRFANAGYGPRYVTLTGTLDVHGYYADIYVDDSEVIGSLEFPVMDVTPYDDMTVEVTGYYIWTSLSADGIQYVDIAVTDFTVLDTGTTKLVKSIVVAYDDGDEDSYDFKYDDKGRVIEVQCVDAEGEFKYQYFEWNDSDYTMTVYPTTGYIGDPATYYFDSDWVLEKYDDDESGTWYISYYNGKWSEYGISWEGNNLTEDLWYVDGELEIKNSFEYYTMVNKSNIEFYEFLGDGSLDWAPSAEMYDRTVFGAFWSQDLVQKYSHLDYVIEGMSYECLYEYEFDDDGYVVKVEVYDEESEQMSEFATIEYYE